jgi:hypothetical protein
MLILKYQVEGPLVHQNHFVNDSTDESDVNIYMSLFIILKIYLNLLLIKKGTRFESTYSRFVFFIYLSNGFDFTILK